MKDISTKNRIIALTAFLFAALILTVRSAWPFTFVFFGSIGLMLLFADKIINSEKIKNRTIFAFCVFGACYQTFYQIFNRVHEIDKQAVEIIAIAVFFAAVLALTDRNKLIFPILAAPLLCFLDIRIAICYIILLLSFTVVLFAINSSANSKKTKPASKSKSPITTKNLLILSFVISIVCLGVCIYLAFQSQSRRPERIEHLFFYFKNTLGFLVAAVYLFLKVFRLDFKARTGVLIGIVLHIATMILLAVTFGWTIFSLSCVSLVFFLLLSCLESADITQAIKTDYHNNKYLFYSGFLLMLI